MPLENIDSRDNLQLNISVQSPSMIQYDGRYYMFHAGRGIANWVSRDMENWVRLTPVFTDAPEWTYSIDPEFGNYVRAPSIYQYNETFYLYYHVSSSEHTGSAIGLVTNKSLDPKSSRFEWKDQGIVLKSYTEHDKWNPTEAALAFDEEEVPWLTYGSDQTVITLVKLNDDLKTAADTTKKDGCYNVANRSGNRIIDECNTEHSSGTNKNEFSPNLRLESDNHSENEAIEAPFIFKKGGYFYLFVSIGDCCQGIESTSRVITGRSESIKGPYIDITGQRMDQGGGSLVVKGNEEYAAVGHASVYTFDQTDYLVAQGYDLTDEGRPKLLILELTWDDDGWPVVELDNQGVSDAR